MTQKTAILGKKRQVKALLQKSFGLNVKQMKAYDRD